MANFIFTTFGNQAIIVKFTCDECGEKVISEEIGIPEPNFEADNFEDSQTINKSYAICDKCKKYFNISIYSSNIDGLVVIEELSDVFDAFIEVEEIPKKLDEYYEQIINTILLNRNFISMLRYYPSLGPFFINS